MWAWLASRVLRNRPGILILVALVTVFLGWRATQVGMNYKHGGLLPKTDSAYAEYERFLHTFSEDGNVLVLGTAGADLYTPGNFGAWFSLGERLKAIDGVDSVFSEAHLFELIRDDSLQRFTLKQVVGRPPATQQEMDTLLAKLRSLRFYEGLLYNDSTHATLMMALR